MSDKNTLLMIPAYNEEESIGAVLTGLKEKGFLDRIDVLVVNDGSKDATAQICREHGIEVLTQVYNMGYGAALQTAYKYAVEKGYEYLLQMDADGQHDLVNIDLICDKLMGEPAAGERVPDIVIGSRFLEGAQSFYMSPAKKPVIAAFRGIIKAKTGYQLTDPTSGLWGLNRKAFSYFAIRNNFDVKYPDVNMILQMLLEGYHIVEIPAIMHERTAGTSMHSGLGSALKYGIVMSLSTMSVLVRNYTPEVRIDVR